MKITDVSARALSSPIDPPQERQFHGGVRRLLKRDVVVVTVETTDGARGVAPAGASSSAMREYFEGDSQGTFADVVEGPVADAVVGETVEDVERLHEVVDGTGLPHLLRNQAAAAVDVACYDLRGKAVGAPVADLLAERFGTTPAETLPLYASAGMYMEPEGYAEQATVLEDLGFAGYKYRPGIGPDADRRTVELLAKTVEMDVMLDAHTWWKMGERSYGSDRVASLVRHAGERGVYWVEEPVEPDDYDGYAELAGLAPLAGGESEESPEGLVALADTGAVDFLQGDVRHHRGFTGCARVVDHCRDRDVTFVPHNFGTWLGLVANAHLVAAAPGAELVEYPVFEADPALAPALTESTDAAPAAPEDPGMYPFDLAFEILDDTLEIEDGWLTLPDAPGLGVTVNEDAFDAYPFVEGPWTEFDYEGA